MSDKVVRHYSRPYGDCRADKRLYFGGSWPWQMGGECEVSSGVGPYYIMSTPNDPAIHYMWIQTGVSSREILDSWVVPNQDEPFIHDVTSAFSLSAVTSLPGVSRTLLFSKAVWQSGGDIEMQYNATVIPSFTGSYSLITLAPDTFPLDPTYFINFSIYDPFIAIKIDDYTASSGTILSHYTLNNWMPS